jgi:hypothetical protein
MGLALKLYIRKPCSTLSILLFLKAGSPRDWTMSIMSIRRSLPSRVFLRTTLIESNRRWRDLRPSESVTLSFAKSRKGSPLGLYTEAIGWSSVGIGGSQFGHFSLDVNGWNYSWAPPGQWDLQFPFACATAPQACPTKVGVNFSHALRPNRIIDNLRKAAQAIGHVLPRSATRSGAV